MRRARNGKHGEVMERRARPDGDDAYSDGAACCPEIICGPARARVPPVLDAESELDGNDEKTTVAGRLFLPSVWPAPSSSGIASASGLEGV